jgi:hypothetical protein
MIAWAFLHRLCVARKVHHDGHPDLSTAHSICSDPLSSPRSKDALLKAAGFSALREDDYMLCKVWRVPRLGVSVTELSGLVEDVGCCPSSFGLGESMSVILSPLDHLADHRSLMMLAPFAFVFGANHRLMLNWFAQFVFMFVQCQWADDEKGRPYASEFVTLEKVNMSSGEVRPCFGWLESPAVRIASLSARESQWMFEGLFAHPGDLTCRCRRLQTLWLEEGKLPMKGAINLHVFLHTPSYYKVNNWPQNSLKVSNAICNRETLQFSSRSSWFVLIWFLRMP